MVAAPGRTAAGRIPGALAALCLTAALAAVAGCQQRAPLEPTIRPPARHPIQPPAEPRSPAPTAVDSGEPRPLTPGPNPRISPTPDMAPRVGPSVPAGTSSPRRDLEELNRDLRRQRDLLEREDPGPPAGTIDRRPGTIRRTPGTIEIPR
ncbi:hypothetical protein GCM10017083_24330 [Thalassobaculum fulvum]|uniref:Uncharacterized protein n=1 Tax=Thalassobaculum fulvum TaxID=1633335 RepID=A0A919CQY3_9PROT|nr:hypothetical protein GCM10017083_24330 [Thalassobaculum fulvum]